MLQSVTKYHRVFLAHLLGPFFGLVNVDYHRHLGTHWSPLPHFNHSAGPPGHSPLTEVLCTFSMQLGLRVVSSGISVVTFGMPPSSVDSSDPEP